MDQLLGDNINQEVIKISKEEDKFKILLEMLNRPVSRRFLFLRRLNIELIDLR